MMDYNVLHEPLIPILRLVLPNSSIPSAGLLLDLAAGDCIKWACYRELLGESATLIGLDNNAQALYSSQETSVICADAHTLPFQPAIFDGALCVAAIGLFANPTQVLAEVRRVLRPDAPLFIATAERLWAQQSQWPAALTPLLTEIVPELILPSANPDLIEPMITLANATDFPRTNIRAFLLEPSLPPPLAELSLIPWPILRPLLTSRLTPQQIADCDEQNSDPAIDLVSIAILATFC